tara:strand:- start:2034 stop:2798 length:765 start_codon:yes stop_codon:yes gene_type:complete
MSLKYKNHHFLFVNGLHRSGTSILFKLIKAQKNISGFNNTGVFEDEGQHLQSVYPAAKDYGGPGKFGFQQQAYLDENSNLITEENRIKLFKQWSVYWDLNNSILVEKSPPNIIRTRFLQAMYPNSSYLTITRHPIAVSFATQKWSHNSLDRLIKHWIICHEAYQRDQALLKSELLVKYEDFCAEPDTIVNKISMWIDSEMIIDIGENIQNMNSKYFKMWEKYQKGFFTGFMAQRIIKKYENKLNEFGYSLLTLR